MKWHAVSSERLGYTSEVTAGRYMLYMINKPDNSIGKIWVASLPKFSPAYSSLSRFQGFYGFYARLFISEKVT